MRLRPLSLLVVVWLAAVRTGPALAHVALEEQIEAVTARIAASPDDAALYLQRAELHRAHADWRAAESDYRRAARLAPEMTAVDLGRGRMELERGRAERAIEALDRALAKRPDLPEAWLLRGRSLSLLGRSCDAAADLARGIDRFASSRRPRPEDYLDLARSRLACATDGAAGALAAIDAGLARLGPAVTLQLEAVEIEIAGADRDAALDRLQALPGSVRDSERGRDLARRVEAIEP